MSDDFSQIYSRLVDELSNLVELLHLAGATSWANWLDRDRDRIVRGDCYGLVELRSAFGGMGSFDDLVIHSLNGHSVSQADDDSVNRRLGRLRSSVRSDAGELKRHLDRPPSRRDELHAALLPRQALFRHSRLVGHPLIRSATMILDALGAG